jgi:hypothetical protein
MRLRLPRIDRTTAFIALGAVLLGALYVVAATWVESHFAETVSSTSSLSSSGEGLKVWYDYLGRFGVAPRQLTEFGSLPASATVVLAGPFETAPTAADAGRLASWVRDGGRAVVVGLDEGGILGTIGSLDGDVSADAGSVVGPAYPSAYAPGISRIAAGSGRLTVDGPAWVALYGDSIGATLVTRRYGRGEVVWLADVTPVSNDGISRADDARFAVRLALEGGRPVYFDEYHHGLTSEVGAWTRLGLGGQAALVLILAAVAVLLFARGRRIGPAIERPGVPAARGGAYIAQLAELFRTAGARSEALAALEDGVSRAIARRYGTREAGLARQPGAREALARSVALRRRGRIAKDEFVTTAALLRAARNEVEGGNG